MPAIATCGVPLLNTKSPFIGVLVVAIGLILVPLPGPGWLIVFVGLTILGTEFHWARRLLAWLRRVLSRFWERWTSWREARRQRAQAVGGHHCPVPDVVIGARRGQPRARQSSSRPCRLLQP